ncbi:FISUMP domain-containing protein [Dysgonomonas sp. 25]|uniref:FISUMP domain-containing protein n=1 Tax=Dysgonomonas sp. 25 TaxID=2302933 RepID=UPI0013D52678|nr:FISUMP domain-containing protein [Dysgonomonas sp. 25]
MNTRTILTRAILLVALVIGAISLNGQVTIGSGQTANPGALLDLKQDGTTTKGLKLPIVSLSDPDNLFPMFTDDGSNGYVEGTKATEDALHAGLMVYNSKYCDGQFAKGLYVWTGDSWEQITDNEVHFAAGLYFTGDTLHLPSGMDARASAAQTFNFTWDRGTHADWSTLRNAVAGGLVFTQAYAHMTPASQTWATSPSVLSVYPDDMTSSLVTEYYPWRTRQSMTTITAYSVDCPPTTKELILNQTNYAFYPILSSIRIIDSSPSTFSIRGNAAWKATVVPGSASSVSEIFSGYTTATKGVTRPVTGYDTNIFDYTGAAGGTGTKYKTAIVTFKDVHNRAKDLIVEAIQCQGTHDLSVVTISATPSQTTTGHSSWGTKVVHHQEKAGVYKEFYSADFGGAGRWMVTNLTATNYDGITHSAGRTLTGPSRGIFGSSSGAYWCYPSATTYDTSTEHDANQFLGYLYTWDAATAGKGGSTGLVLNIEEEGTNHTKVQGICPSGWHLPSDREWTILENEIIRNTTKYANITTDIDNSGLSDIPYNAGSLSRDTPHGAAMKDPCENFSNHNNGTSKAFSQGGFSFLFAGQYYPTTTTNGDFGRSGYFWTSSVQMATYQTVAWARQVTGYSVRVTKNGPYANASSSVRCKKD